MSAVKINLHGNDRWQVNYTFAGQTRRPVFKTEEAAKRFMRSREGAGQDWMDIPQDQRAAMLAAWQRAREGGYSLADACAAVEAKTAPKQVRVSQVIEDCQKSKEAANRRRRYLLAFRSTCRQIQASFGDRVAGEVTTKEVEDWLNGHGWAASTRRSHRNDFQTLMSFAVGRGWIDKNPVSGVPCPSLDDKPPGILTLDQCRALMAAARKHDPGLCGFLSLALFAGIRPSQLLRMSPDDIRVREGVARAAGWQTKSRQNRIVELSRNCRAWCKVGLELPPLNFRRRFYRIRLLAEITAWPQDAMRHSFASYHLAALQSADRTASQLGHRSTQMVFQHYRDLVTPAQGRAFFKIMPL